MENLNEIKDDLKNYLEHCKEHLDNEITEIQITLAFDQKGWAIQIGDNSFTGPAYTYKHWLVSYITVGTTTKDLIKDFEYQLKNSIFE